MLESPDVEVELHLNSRFCNPVYDKFYISFVLLYFVLRIFDLGPEKPVCGILDLP